jgi:hypothetical protein
LLIGKSEGTLHHSDIVLSGLSGAFGLNALVGALFASFDGIGVVTTASRSTCVRPLPVPTEQRVGRDDRGDLAQRPTADPERPHGDPSPVVTRQAQAPPTKLPAQEEVLFDQVGDRLPFSAFEPAGEDYQRSRVGQRSESPGTTSSQNE